MRPSAGGGRHKFFNEIHERVTVRPDIAVEIHELQNKVDSFRGRISLSRRHDIAFAHDRHIAFDHEAATRVPIAKDGTTNHDALIRLEFDFEGH